MYYVIDGRQTVLEPTADGATRQVGVHSQVTQLIVSQEDLYVCEKYSRQEKN